MRENFSATVRHIIVHYLTVRFANTRPTPAHGATDPGAGATLGRFGLARGQWRKTAPAPCFCADLKQFESRGKENARASVLNHVKSDHGEFYRTRADAERALALAADTPNVRERHLRAAEVWDRLAEREALVKAAKAGRAASPASGKPVARKPRSRVNRLTPPQ